MEEVWCGVGVDVSVSVSAGVQCIDLYLYRIGIVLSCGFASDYSCANTRGGVAG